MATDNDEIRELQKRAGEAFDAGRLREAATHYGRLVELVPDGDAFHYRLGLAHKYLREWPLSLRDNLRVLALDDEHDEGASWNAGIAATAIGDWPQARRQWRACGIDIEEGAGPVEDNFGPVGIRLNPWRDGETVFAQRIDPARARIMNVPLPGSGHRFGDLVLQDGMQVGERHFFEHTVPVFNELQRLEASDYVTWTVFLVCEGEADIEALLGAEWEGIGQAEDWTRALGQRCLRCTHAVPHRHQRHGVGDGAWNPDRTLGIAAPSEAPVRALLDHWVAQAPGRRRLEAIAREDGSASEPDGASGAWWRSPKAPG